MEFVTYEVRIKELLNSFCVKFFFKPENVISFCLCPTGDFCPQTPLVKSKKIPKLYHGPPIHNT